MSSSFDNSGTKFVSADGGAMAPLSYEQEGIWLGSRFASGPADFHNLSALRLVGDLDVPRLEAALTAVAARHDILRTIFSKDDSQPGQRVIPVSPLRLQMTDAPDGDAIAWKSPACESFLRRMAAPPFDLSAAPPWRPHLIRLAAREHVLVVVFHHIVVDGMSAAIFQRDLAAFYNGDGATFPALRVRYAEYAAADRARRHAQIARDIEDWRSHLAGTSRSLEFSPPLHQPAEQRAHRRFSIDAPLAAKVEQIAGEHGATTFGALSAALAVTLSRVSGDLDLSLNIIRSTRRSPEVQDIIGALVDTVVLRLELAPSPTFVELLGHVHDRLRWGFARPVPHFKLVRALATPGARGSNEVAINYHKASTQPHDMTGLQTSEWRIAGGHSPYAMVLEVYNDRGTLDCLIDYDATRISSATIERITDGLPVFLDAASAAPHASIDALPSISPAATAARLLEQPKGHATAAHHSTVPELFAQQVRADARALAIRDRRGDWTIGAVDEQSSRLANLLLARGVQPGACVGICLERSADFVIAALAVMKAGAAYLPIDPAYPLERIRLMTAIAQPSLVISREQFVERLPGESRLLHLDRESASLTAASCTAPAIARDPDAAAYVLFTSGSTGRPRGVTGLHRGIVNRIAWMRRTYPFWSDEACAQKTTVGFVDSVWEIFGPLTSGVPLVIFEDSVVSDARSFAQALAHHHVTRVVLVPSLLEALLDAIADTDDALQRLRLCVCSGEPLSPALAARCRARLPHVTLLNIYGSSEVSADVTWCEVTPGAIADRVSIGRPIDNVCVYLLDPARQLVPPGDEGEIYVGGAALAAGYCGDEDATAERFVRDPFDPTGQRRLFKTGDRGRVRPDGELEVLGRRDQQIKFLGRRIEPAEIETALASHPSVRQAAVVLHREREVLVAFVAPRSPDGIDRSAVNEFLRGHLPHFMVPSAIITVDTLPLSPHGKIDRAALAIRELTGLGSPDGGAPESGLEQLVATLWSEVLGVSPRSADDDFIALGGHSLRATRLAWRVRERLGINMSPGAVFEHSTVRRFAAEIARLSTNDHRGLPPILPAVRSAVMQPSAVQQQFWLEEHLQNRRGSNHHGGTYKVRGPFDLVAFDRSVTAVLSRHEALRTISVVEGGALRMSVREPAPHVSPVEDLTRVPEHAREAHLESRLQADRRRPFALDKDLPFRVRIYRLAPEDHVISFSAHHSAFDGWSASILVRELSALYAAERRGARAVLDAPPIHYADFAAWQRACSEGAPFAEQRDFWKRQLAGAPPDLELPGDRRSRQNVPPSMGRVPVVLEAALMSQLRALGQREGATTFMTLSAAFATLLARYSGQWDVVIGTAVANRRLPSTQSVIGAFVNTLALRFTLDAAAPFASAVRVARTVTTAAFDHHDLPFDIVVADSAPERRADRTPLFQAMFAIQDQEGWQLDLDGAATTAIDTPPGVSAIPLSLVLHDSGDSVRGYLEYRADVFDAGTITRLGANYAALLRHCASGGETALQDLQIVSDEEAVQLHRFEGAVAPERQWERLEQTFARHAAQTPDAPALAFLDVEYTYREVEQHAQQLAGRLIAMGVAPGQLLAIEVPRSVPLYVAILGVLNAGAAYVVVDPSQPDERRRFIIDDSGAVVLVSAGRDAEDGLLLSALNPEHVEPASDARLADAVACLVYTSGSSGQPKGVRITHRNIAAMSDIWGARQRMTAASRVAQMVSPAFDVALGDIFATWSRGACVCALAPEESMPGRVMIAALARLGVTHWTIPPSLIAECPATPWPELQVIAIGGEPAAADVMARWNQACVINSYGLTEGTVASTAEVYDPTLPPAIGAPLPGVQLRIVDERGVPAPIGAAGEIELAGPQVADGYHRRPDLTAQRFLGSSSDRRLRTGDRGRWLADGRVEFLGRIDRQVKFHGYRIEPGEVEAAARSHPSIEQAFVTVRAHAGEDRLVAYLVAHPGRAATPEHVRAHLRERVPATMCPTDIVFVDAFPRTTTGKIDARALPAPGHDPHPRAAIVSGHAEEIIAGVWRDVLGHSQFNRDQSFFDAGGHSLLLVRAHERLSSHFGDAVSVVDLFAHPTIATLARHLEGRVALPARNDSAPARQGRIAVIGMACRYPKSPSVDALWNNLIDGVECLTRFTPEELASAGLDSTSLADKRFIPVAGVVDGIDQFDAEFFGLSAAEARLIDPQQRLLLELAQGALDSAGYDPRRYTGRVGVFAGVGFNGYLHEVLYPNGIPTTAAGFAAISANDKDFAASQVAYRLDLHGPAITVQTACSTSLVAVDVAIQAILSGRCEMALAGGVSLRVPQASGYRYEEGMILSPDGHCRPFDEAAAGTVGSGGGGVVLLKSLDAAMADGDRIEAVIIGSASNNDGRGKVGFTAPGVEGQTQVIRAALQQSGADPASIQYVETHGTGTALGDPIEIQALNDTYGHAGDAPLAIGSIKSNLGHTDTAAGVAGLIKTVLAIKHDRIPASLHFSSPNPRIDFGRLFVADRALPFPQTPRRAAVSAFGIGGTNAHVILEQPPSSGAPQRVSPASRVFPVSARSEAALRAACSDLAAALERSHGAADDVAFTLQRGRREYAHRHAVVAASLADAAAALSSRGRGAGAWPPAGDGRAAWLFSGQGSQQPGMGRALYESQPVAREWIDRCAEAARPHLGLDLRTMLCGNDSAIHETRYAQPALFALQYALARTWLSFGLAPAALIGHSIGEYAAASIGGVIGLDAAMFLVCERGRLMHQCLPGTMLSIRISESALQDLITDAPVDIAAINAPESCVIAGTAEAIARVREQLTSSGYASRPLITERAFHSRLMADAEVAFERAARAITLSAPSIPIVSTLTGEWMTADEATDPARWRRQLREPVRFLDSVRTLDAHAPFSLLEIGPDQTLSTLARQIVADDRCVTPSLPSLDAAIGRLWAAGSQIDWAAVGPQTGRRVALPSYPFQRSSHWGATPRAANTDRQDRPLDEWFAIPSWSRRSRATGLQTMAGTWLVVTSADDRDAALTRAIEQRGGHVSVARSGHEAVAQVRAIKPAHVVFRLRRSSGDLDRALDQGLHALLDTLRAIGEHAADTTLTLITDDLLDVTGAEVIDPSQAAAVGAMKVAPHEYSNLRCRHIDVSPDVDVTSLVDELCDRADDEKVALRGRQRWLPSWSSVAVPNAAAPFRKDGTYIVTGGFGGVGLTIGRHLGEFFGATVALVGRNGAPLDERWDSTRAAIERAGGTVLTYAADVGDVEQLRAVVEDVRRRRGTIHGCVHAAGTIDRGGVIHRRNRESMDAAIRAKVHGASHLVDLLAGESLDFLILCSTLGSLMPQLKFGQAGYAAGNEYLDAFAAAARRRGVPATTINWDDWSDVGMTVAASVEAAAQGRPHWHGRSIAPAEGVEVMARVAGTPFTQVVVSTWPIDAMQKEMARLFADAVSSVAVPSAPADPAAALLQIWGNALGVQDLTPDSNFFRLGGHSLLAIQVLTSVRELFDVTLPLAGFLDQPVLGLQTQALERALARKTVASVTTAPADTDEDFTL